MVTASDYESAGPAFFPFAQVDNMVNLVNVICDNPDVTALGLGVVGFGPSLVHGLKGRPVVYLGVSEAQRGGQLASVRLGDVLLHLEAFLETLPLQVAEHGPRPRPLAPPVCARWRPYAHTHHIPARSSPSAHSSAVYCNKKGDIIIAKRETVRKTKLG